MGGWGYGGGGTGWGAIPSGNGGLTGDQNAAITNAYGPKNGGLGLSSSGGYGSAPTGGAAGAPATAFDPKTMSPGARMNYLPAGLRMKMQNPLWNPWSNIDGATEAEHVILAQMFPEQYKSGG